MKVGGDEVNVKCASDDSMPRHPRDPRHSPQNVRGPESKRGDTVGQRMALYRRAAARINTIIEEVKALFCIKA